MLALRLSDDDAQGRSVSFWIILAAALLLLNLKKGNSVRGLRCSNSCTPSTSIVSAMQGTVTSSSWP